MHRLATRIDRFLCTKGDGTGNKHANGNYTVPTPFFIQPPSGNIFRITRLIAYIEAAVHIDAAKYGHNIILTNGITINTMCGDELIHDMTDGVPIMTNSHWSRFAWDSQLHDYGTGDQALTVTWPFNDGEPRVGIRLIGETNERLEVVLHDDFSDLIDHTFVVHGHIETQAH